VHTSKTLAINEHFELLGSYTKKDVAESH